MVKFRRGGDHPAAAALFDMLTRYAEAAGVHLGEAFSKKQVLEALRAAVTQARSPIRLHGRRAEEMFSYVAASLGMMRAVKREDAGELLVRDDLKVSVPDFRLISSSGEHLLVEVKNSNSIGLTKGVGFKRSYLEQLNRYGDLVSAPVYCAIYWRRWRLWTLHSVSWLLRKVIGDRGTMTFGDAIRESEMRELGDATLGTTFPLTLSFSVDSKVLSRSGSTSQVSMTIQSVTITAGGKEVLDPRDKSIAFGFMLYGKWNEAEPLLGGDGDTISEITFTFTPDEPDPHQHFGIVGSLSSLASAQFDQLTLDDRGVKRIRVGSLALPPYPTLNARYNGKDLPLWVLVQQPSFEDSV